MIAFLVATALAALVSFASCAAGPARSPRAGAPCGVAESTAAVAGAARATGTPFSLSVSELREERRDPSTPSRKSTIVFETQLTLHGRFVRENTENRAALAVFADSMTFASRRPLAYRTFLSADTMYHHAPGGTAEVDRADAPAIDSMLACLFGGPAFRAHLGSGSAIDSLEHLNSDCLSGEYRRMNLPVTLGFFLPDPQWLAAEEGARWQAPRVPPLFSGVDFRPAVEFQWQAVAVALGQVTVVFSADSTFGRRQTTLAKGEEAVITRDRILAGGTIVLDRETALPVSGEVRIREHMEMLRPQLGPDVFTKSGEYTIRIRTQ
jgi:hypothetical protein